MPFNRVRDGIAIYHLVFQGFWYVWKILLMDFLHHNIIWCSLFIRLERPRFLKQSDILSFEQQTRKTGLYENCYQTLPDISAGYCPTLQMENKKHFEYGNNK